MLTERLLKTAPGSTHFKNAQLYACGCLVYLPALWAATSGAAPSLPGATGAAARAAALFAGWSPITLLLLANLSLQGLAVSFLLRAAGNIEKLFAGAAALFMSVGLSAPLFGLRPRGADLAGGALVAAALTAFHWRELRAGRGRAGA